MSRKGPARPLAAEDLKFSLGRLRSGPGVDSKKGCNICTQKEKSIENFVSI